MTTQKLENQPKCIWKDDHLCPIRREIRRITAFGKRVKPDDEMGAMMSGMMSALNQNIPVELQLLHNYCPLCPFYQKHIRIEVKQ